MQYFNNSLVSIAEVKELSILKPWKSLMVIFLEWMIIVTSIYIHKLFPTFIIYVLVWFVIATRLYAMYSLIHDAIHYSITRNKKWNDIIAQIFLGFPLFISLKKMRKAHLAHHKYLQTDDDPEMQHLKYKEFRFPKTKWQLVLLFLLDFTGINFVYYTLLKLFNLFFHFNINKIGILLEVVIFTIVLFAAYYFGFFKDLVLYWLIPYATLYQVLNRIRLSTEHFNIDENNDFKTRSVIPNFIERCIFVPNNLGYHLEHHLYPGIPFYNLPKLHDILISQKNYTTNAIIQQSYTQVLKDFIKK